MAFPSHARHPALGSTPSDGQAEVMRALYSLDMRRIGVTAGKVAVNLSRLVTAGDAQAVLDSISGTFITKTGSGLGATYALTRAGIKAAIRWRPRPIFGFDRGGY